MPLPVLVAALFLQPQLTWSRLPDVPDAEGFAGAFAGTSGGAVVLAGGANFPAGRPWEGGAKVWHDSIFVLEPGAASWRAAGRLPARLAYGVSVTHGDRVVCVGGSDAAGHSAEVCAIRWDGKAIETTALPSLPRPLALQSGAVLGSMLVVAGGTESPDAVVARRECLALDLAAPAEGWRELPPLPGPGRILASAGVAAGRLHLFGGAALEPAADGKPVRIWLRDAYRYDPATGWSRLADLPRPAVAPPSPLPLVGGGLLAVLGGDDGSQSGQDPARHAGFRRDMLGFDPAAGRWRSLGDLPFALVTTAAVPWEGGIVVPGGESRPGVRSTAVWYGKAEAGQQPPAAAPDEGAARRGNSDAR